VIALPMASSATAVIASAAPITWNTKNYVCELLDLV
jgi:hypothetical protein